MTAEEHHDTNSDELNETLPLNPFVMEKESLYRLAESGDAESAAALQTGQSEGEASIATSQLLDKLQPKGGSKDSGGAAPTLNSDQRIPRSRS